MNRDLSAVPANRQAGVLYVESLSLRDAELWLLQELFEVEHRLSGQAEDYPVQAILNHYPHFSAETQGHIASFCKGFASQLAKPSNIWTQSATRHLLSLVAELPVPACKPILKSFVTKDGFSGIPPALHPAVLRAIATLSSKDDRGFWESVQNNHPDFSRMTEQVFARID